MTTAQYWAQFDIEEVVTKAEPIEYIELMQFYNGKVFFVVHSRNEWDMLYPKIQAPDIALPSKKRLQELADAAPRYTNPSVTDYSGVPFSHKWKPPGWRPYQDVDYRDPAVHEKWGANIRKGRRRK